VFLSADVVSEIGCAPTRLNSPCWWWHLSAPNA